MIYFKLWTSFLFEFRCGHSKIIEQLADIYVEYIKLSTCCRIRAQPRQKYLAPKVHAKLTKQTTKQLRNLSKIIRLFPKLLTIATRWQYNIEFLCKSMRVICVHKYFQSCKKKENRSKMGGNAQRKMKFCKKMFEKKFYT